MTTMPAPAGRRTFRALMIAVAVVALGIVAAPHSISLAILLGGPLGLLALVDSCRRRFDLTWSRAATWLGAAYPWAALVAILGHDVWPGGGLGGSGLGPGAALLARLAWASLPVALLATACLVASEVAVASDDEAGPGRRPEALRLILIPLASWGVAGVALAGLEAIAWNAPT